MTPELAETLLRQAVATDEDVTFDEVLIEIGCGLATAFESEHAVEVVKLLDHPNGDRECYAAWGACVRGYRHELVNEIRPRVEEWARMNDADFIELQTRPIAGRFLGKLGYALITTDGKQATFRKML